MIQTENDRSDYEYYMTDEEVRLLLRDADENASPKWRLYIYLSLLLGRRSQVTLAMNMFDFPGIKELDVSRVEVKENKDGKRHIIPVPEVLQDIILEYIYIYRDTLIGGYFFPANHQSRWKRPYINSQSASAYFSKARKRIGGSFLEKYDNGQHRIHPHTLRHWYQSRIAHIEKDPYILQRLMGYQKMESVLSYVRKANYHSHARSLVDGAFSGLGVVPKGQSVLSEF